MRFVGKLLPPQKRSKAAAVGGVYLDGGPRQAFGKGMYFLAMFMNLKNQIWIGTVSYTHLTLPTKRIV